VNQGRLQPISLEAHGAGTTGRGKVTQGHLVPPPLVLTSGVDSGVNYLVQRRDHRWEQHRSLLAFHVPTPSLRTSPVQNYEPRKSVFGEDLGGCKILLGFPSLLSLWMDVVTLFLFRYKCFTVVNCFVMEIMKNLREIMGSGLYVYA